MSLLGTPSARSSGERPRYRFAPFLDCRLARTHPQALLDFLAAAVLIPISFALGRSVRQLNKPLLPAAQFSGSLSIARAASDDRKESRKQSKTCQSNSGTEFLARARRAHAGINLDVELTKSCEHYRSTKRAVHTLMFDGIPSS